MTSSQGAGGNATGDTTDAGAGLSDAEFAARVAGQTSSDLQARDVFTRESAGATTSGPATDLVADDLDDSDGSGPEGSGGDPDLTTDGR